MRTFLCHRCNKQFTVTNPNWVSAVCPHCNTNHRLPNYPQETQTVKIALIVRMIGGIILFIIGLVALL